MAGLPAWANAGSQTLYDPNVVSVHVEKAAIQPYVVTVEVKVSDIATRRYGFFESGEGVVTLEDGTTATISLKDTAAFFGYSEESFARAPVLHMVAAAEAWTETPGLFKTSVPLNSWLLDLIDQHAYSYFNSSWNLNLNQFKAWLATIAWAEGGLGGYGAHSQGAPGSDLFYHIVAGSSFRFSTGIGPFQMDRRDSFPPYDWGLWKTIDKLDPQRTVPNVARWHRDNRPAGSRLSDFAANSPWVAVRTPSTHWTAVTGTAWNNHSGGSASLDWSAIKNALIANAAAYP